MHECAKPPRLGQLMGAAGRGGHCKGVGEEKEEEEEEEEEPINYRKLSAQLYVGKFRWGSSERTI